MRVAIIGSRPEGVPARDDARWQAVAKYVRELPADTIIVSGGANGADSWADDAAERNALIRIVCHPAWQRRDGSTDRSAGHRRNAVIAEIADRCVAFFGAGESRGTEGCVAMFRRLGKDVTEWRFTAAGEYRRADGA